MEHILSEKLPMASLPCRLFAMVLQNIARSSKARVDMALLNPLINMTHFLTQSSTTQKTVWFISTKKLTLHCKYLMEQFQSIYIRRVGSQLLLYMQCYISFLPGWSEAETKCTVNVAQPKRPNLAKHGLIDTYAKKIVAYHLINQYILCTKTDINNECLTFTVIPEPPLQ